jgi:hypothetical protein
MKRKVLIILGIGLIAVFFFYNSDTRKLVNDSKKSSEKEIKFHQLKGKNSKLGFSKSNTKRKVAAVDIKAKRKKLLAIRKKLWEKHHAQKIELQNRITHDHIPVYKKRFIIEEGLYLVRNDRLESIGHYDVFKKMGPYSIVETDNPPENLPTVVRDIKSLNLGYYTGEIKVELNHTNDIDDIIENYNGVKVLIKFEHLNTAIIEINSLVSANDFIDILKKDARVKDAQVDIVMSNRRAN